MSKELRPIGLSLQTLQRGPYDRARPALCVPPLRAGQQESSLLQRPPEKGPPVLRGHDGRRGHPATLKIKFRENENEKTLKISWNLSSKPRIIIAGAFGYLTLTPALQLEEDSTLLKKSWSCSKCSKSFSQQASLSRHDREVHQAQLSHPCPACPSKFPRREHLQRHLQRVHRELLISEQSTTSTHATSSSS